MAAHGGRITSRAGVVVVSKGVVPPLGTLPSAFAAERCKARALGVVGGPANATEMLERGGSVVVASLDRGFTRQLKDILSVAKLDVLVTNDVTGVELAGAAKNVAALAAAAAGSQAAPMSPERRRAKPARCNRCRSRWPSGRRKFPARNTGSSSPGPARRRRRPLPAAR